MKSKIDMRTSILQEFSFVIHYRTFALGRNGENYPWDVTASEKKLTLPIENFYFNLSNT
jgi:hypothetical protein